MYRLCVYAAAFALSALGWLLIGSLIGLLWRADHWAVGGLLLAGVLALIALMPSDHAS